MKTERRFSSEELQRRSLERKVKAANANLKAKNIIPSNNVSELVVPNGVATETYQRRLSLHETLCSASRHQHPNLRSVPLMQSSLSPTKVQAYLLLRPPVNTGMSTPKKSAMYRTNKKPSSIPIPTSKSIKDAVFSSPFVTFDREEPVTNDVEGQGNATIETTADETFQSAVGEPFESEARNAIFSMRGKNDTAAAMAPMTLHKHHSLRPNAAGKSNVSGVSSNDLHTLTPQNGSGGAAIFEEFHENLTKSTQRIDSVLQLIGESLNKSALLENSLEKARLSPAKSSDAGGKKIESNKEAATIASPGRIKQVERRCLDALKEYTHTKLILLDAKCSMSVSETTFNRESKRFMDKFNSVKERIKRELRHTGPVELSALEKYSLMIESIQLKTLERQKKLKLLHDARKRTALLYNVDDIHRRLENDDEKGRPEEEPINSARTSEGISSMQELAEDVSRAPSSVFCKSSESDTKLSPPPTAIGNNSDTVQLAEKDGAANDASKLANESSVIDDATQQPEAIENVDEAAQRSEAVENIENTTQHEEEIGINSCLKRSKSVSSTHSSTSTLTEAKLITVDGEGSTIVGETHEEVTAMSGGSGSTSSETESIQEEIQAAEASEHSDVSHSNSLSFPSDITSASVDPKNASAPSAHSKLCLSSSSQMDSDIVSGTCAEKPPADLSRLMASLSINSPRASSPRTPRSPLDKYITKYPPNNVSPRDVAASSPLSSSVFSPSLKKPTLLSPIKTRPSVVATPAQQKDASGGSDDKQQSPQIQQLQKSDDEYDDSFPMLDNLPTYRDSMTPVLDISRSFNENTSLLTTSSGADAKNIQLEEWSQSKGEELIADEFDDVVWTDALAAITEESQQRAQTSSAEVPNRSIGAVIELISRNESGAQIVLSAIESRDAGTIQKSRTHQAILHRAERTSHRPLTEARQLLAEWLYESEADWRRDWLDSNAEVCELALRTHVIDDTEV